MLLSKRQKTITPQGKHNMKMNDFINGLHYDRETDLYTSPDAPGVTFDGIGQAMDYYNEPPRK